MMFRAGSRFSNLPPYKPIEPFEVLTERLGLAEDAIIKLDANENPYGASPRVIEAFSQLKYTHIYPDPESRRLREALEGFCCVPCENLLAGCGADELIDLLLRVMLEPGDKVINCPPTFGMYEFDTRLNYGELVEINRQEDFSLDVEGITNAVERFQPKLIFLTNPNNPDGWMIGEELDALLDLPILIVLDEAYIEFTQNGSDLGKGNSRIRQVPSRDNLIVLRTFSKWAGLAGLRAGYGAFPSWLMPTLWKAKQPYNVSVAASEAAIASIEDYKHLAENVERINNERKRLFEELVGIPYLQPFPSKANFILCKVIERSALGLKESLAKEGILIRHYQTPLLKNMVRISVGRSQDNDFLIKVLEKLI